MLRRLHDIHKEIKDLRKDIGNEKTKTIAKKTLRDRTENLGMVWFSEISGLLVNEYNISPDTIEFYSLLFGRLIKISAPSNPKASYLETLTKLRKSFRNDLVLPIQKRPKGSSDISLLTKMLDGISNPKEDEYLKEAVNCAKHNYLRAAVVLGWCAAIDHIHRVIENNRFAKFNITSASMASKTKGRFKRFNSPQNISSISELREVFDTIVLWILEGMRFIDSNQQTRLRSCFDLRCQCAHPGDAPVTEYNLLSFFSDINEIIFKNPSFKI